MQDRAGRGRVSVDSHDGIRGKAPAVCGSLKGFGREDDRDSRGKVVSHEDTGVVIVSGGVLEVGREAIEGMAYMYDVFVIVNDEGKEDRLARGCVEESSGYLVVARG